MKYQFLFVLLILFVGGAVGESRRVRMRDMSALSFTNGRMTEKHRGAPVPQMECIGGEAKRHASEVRTASCRNIGWDGSQVIWECELFAPEGLRVGAFDVVCEGWERGDTEYVGTGTCQLEYELHGAPRVAPRAEPQQRDERRSEQPRPGRARTENKHNRGVGIVGIAFFVMLAIMVVVFLGAYCMKDLMTSRRRRAATYIDDGIGVPDRPCRWRTVCELHPHLTCSADCIYRWRRPYYNSWWDEWVYGMAYRPPVVVQNNIRAYRSTPQRALAHAHTAQRASAPEAEPVYSAGSSRSAGGSRVRDANVSEEGSASRTTLRVRPTASSSSSTSGVGGSRMRDEEEEDGGSGGGFFDMFSSSSSGASSYSHSTPMSSTSGTGGSHVRESSRSNHSSTSSSHNEGSSSRGTGGSRTR